jgi:hypothetical protein
MAELDENVILQLRDMARRGESVGRMFTELKQRLEPGATIVTILEYMRSAFCLSLAEAKPIAALSRTDQREVLDEGLLHELVMPEIDKHRGEWDR